MVFVSKQSAIRLRKTVGFDHLTKSPDDNRVAELIAAEAALAALDASGTPVLAALLDPFRLVHANAAAGEVLSDPRTIRRLFDHAWPETVRLNTLSSPTRRSGEEDIGPRLERATLEIGGTCRRLILLCREFTDAQTGRHYYVLAVPGFAPADEAAHAPTALLRANFRSRFGASSLRFLWKTDAQDHLIFVDQALADVLGRAGLTVGADVGEVARGLGGGDEWLRAIGSRRSWSGVRVEWPLADGTGVVPVTLGGLPAADNAGSFAGYNGYGLIQLSQITAKEPSRHLRTDRDPPSTTPANVVPLRPTLAAIPRTDPPTPPESLRGAQTQLTESELSAFAEIARTLGKDEASSPDAPDTLSQKPDGNDCAVASASTDAITKVLDLLPIGVLVARGTQTLFVNRTLLSAMGYADRAGFVTDGGLARIFMGRLSMGIDSHLEDMDPHLETIDWDGAPATMISFIRAPIDTRASECDELEMKHARVRSDNAMLRAVIDVLDGAVAVLDEAGRIESATTAFASLLGAEKSAFDGLALSSAILPEDAAELMARAPRAETGQPLTLRVTPRETLHALEATIGRLPVETAKLFIRLRPAAVGCAAEHQAAREEAERADRAKSDFLIRIGHEIRTPLNAIIGFTEAMIEERFGPVGSRRYRDYLKDIQASGAHVLSLINDLLDLSKIEAGKMDLSFAPVDANVVIVECMSIMHPQANNRRIVMRQALATGLPPINADNRALRQILLNLLSNAVKFTPGGGQVIVSTALTDTGHVLVRVKDTGIGMSEDDVRLALEPFRQITPVTDMRGTGLGLPLTKALIEVSGGSLTIQSRPQEGTLMEIAFPSTQSRAAELAI